MDQSPFYNDPQDPYIQDIDLIELPSDDITPDQKKFQYGSTFNPGGPLSNFNNRGQRINKFYQTLRPYYVK